MNASATLDLQTRTEGNPISPVDLWTAGRSRYQSMDFEAARALFAAALEHFGSSGEQRSYTQCLVDAARVEIRIGHLERARPMLERALLESRQCGDKTCESDALNTLGNLHNLAGDPRGALALLERVLEIKRELGDNEGWANTLNNIGIVHTDLGEYHRALEALFEGYKRSELHDLPSQGICLLNIGNVYHALGELKEALSFFNKGLAFARSHASMPIEIECRVNIAIVHLGLGNDQRALRLFAEAVSLSQKASYPRYLAIALKSMGEIHLGLNQWEAALNYLERSLGPAQESGDVHLLADTMVHLGLAHLRASNTTNALEHLLEALKLIEQSDSRQPLSRCHLALSEAYEAVHDLERALTHFKHHHRVSQEIFNQESERKTRYLKVEFETERARTEAETYRVRNEVIEQANTMLEAKVLERTAELEESQLETLNRLALAAEFRDDETGHHTARVGLLSARMAQELGMSEDQVRLIRLAARLHDVGKLGISDAIMLKPGKLTQSEFQTMKTHTQIGAKILSGGKSHMIQMAERIALTHHERWNGQGYPQGLRGDSIPLEGRIVAVADVYDALISERPYKHAWSHQEAIEEIERQSGAFFDPRVVAAFLNLMRA